MNFGADAAAVVIVAAALWVGLAAALAILAARRLRRAQAVLGAARAMRVSIGGAASDSTHQGRLAQPRERARAFCWVE